MLQKYLAIILAVSALLAGCGRQQAAAPETSGSLTGVTYVRSGSVERDGDFHISITETEILSMRYFDPEEADYVDASNLPLEAEAWDAIEDTVMQLAPVPKESESSRSVLQRILGGGVSDGSDRTELSLTWETADGSVTIPYRWDNSDPLYHELSMQLGALVPN